jgi:CRISPR-associated protein (TIGR03986 family)
MAKFYNPYHFVPVERPAPGATTREAFEKERPSNVTHDRYVPETHSGRLVVRLTTLTPTVIGAKRQTESRTELNLVEPFRIDGRAAIPASTLRGLIGSVIEASTNGPLRVLDDRIYSFRRDMKDSLSAIGLVVKHGEELRLKPMCLPTLESRDGGRTFAVAPGFRRIFPTPQFKVYFGDRAGIRSPQFQYSTHTDPAQAVPMPVKQLGWNGNSVAFDRSLHVKANRYAVAQDADSYDPPRPGMVRVLGCFGRPDIPMGKTHELWIPLPHPTSPVLPVAREAVERFEQLADERYEASPELPYEPKGSRPLDSQGKRPRLRLSEGDMVFFNIDPAGTIVTEISFSAIWRGRVEDPAAKEAASAWKFFEKEHRPFNSTRETVSISEQLLGFAEEVEQPKATGKHTDDRRAGLALASRLIFSDALPPDGYPGSFESEVILRILASPKPPCPSMYFKANSGQASYTAKSDLSPSRHLPQGRKWYLHSKGPWASKTGGKDEQKRNKQKSKVTPLSPGQSFFFHIDFDNLSNMELGLLLHAIEPDPMYHHKLGMGKPLGLGTAKLDVMACFFVNRRSRYTLEGLRSDRYDAAEITPSGHAVVGTRTWPGRYSLPASQTPAAPVRLDSARSELTQSRAIPENIQAALALLGRFDSANPPSNVHYPTVLGQTDPEADHYEWFVRNDRSGKQFLKPLSRGKPLPELEELP